MLHIAVGIAIDGAQHSRPGLLEDQESAGAERDGLAVHSDDFGNDAGEWSRGRARLGTNCSGQRRDHDLSGLGLPPCVHNRATVVPDDFAIPHPGFGIDRFADCTQYTKTVELVFLRPFVSPFDECANGGGRGVQNIYLVAVNDAPEAVGFRKIGRAFVHQSGGAILQRSIDDVAVAGDPTNVGSAPIRVFFFEIEYPFCGEIRGDGIPAGRVHDALRFSRRAGCVEDVEHVFGVHLGGLALRLGVAHETMPPVVTACLHVVRRASAFVDDHMFHRWA